MMPEGKSTKAVNQSEPPPSDMLILEANKKMLAEDMATDGTFLDKTSFLMLADDWFGK